MMTAEDVLSERLVRIITVALFFYFNYAASRFHGQSDAGKATCDSDAKAHDFFLTIYLSKTYLYSLHHNQEEIQTSDHRDLARFRRL